MKKMKDTTLFSLSQDIAIPYFQEHLEGGHYLSAYIRSNIDFSSGSFSSLIPRNADLSKANQLSNPGLIPSNITDSSSHTKNEWIESTDDEFIEYFWKKLSQNPQICSITEDRMRIPTDPTTSLFQTAGIVDSQANTYYILKHSRATPHQIKQLISTIPFWHFSSFLFDITGISIETTLSLDALANIASKIQCIIVSAYDGESYVVWETNAGERH